jgi:hypothetical protein
MNWLFRGSNSTFVLKCSCLPLKYGVLGLRLPMYYFELLRLGVELVTYGSSHILALLSNIMDSS